MAPSITGWSLALVKLALNLSRAAYVPDRFEWYGGTLIFRMDESDWQKPAFYVYEVSNALYVCIRGSTTAEDYLTDDELYEQETEFGVFHAGFWNATSYVLGFIEDIVANYQGPVYFFGHSYGASVSSLLLVILRQKYPNKDWNAITIAPMPPMSTELSNKNKDKLVSFRVDDDVVPTLSIPNICQTLWLIDPLFADMPRDLIVNVLEKICDLMEYTGESILSRVMWETLKRDIPLLVDDLQGFARGDVRVIRYSPGTVYQLKSDESKTLDDCLIDVVTQLNRMVLSKKAIADHNTDVYLEAVNKLYE